MRLAGFGCVLAVLACPTWASADPISIVDSARSAYVYTSVTDLSGFQQVRPALAAQGDALYVSPQARTPDNSIGSGEAALFSSLGTPARLTASGAAGATVRTTGSADVSAQSLYDVTFHLDRPYDFSFFGIFSASGTTPFDPEGSNTQTSWRAFLRNGNATFMPFDFKGDTDQRASSTGLLPAGNWMLYVTGSAVVFTRATPLTSALTGYQFRLDLTPANAPVAPTPEPATMLLLGSGAAGLIASRRRR